VGIPHRNANNTTSIADEHMTTQGVRRSRVHNQNNALEGESMTKINNNGTQIARNLRWH
jgi:hypothetical protein